MTDKIKIGITHGDINGISYEVILKTFLDNQTYSNYTPVIYGSPKVAAYHRKALDIENLTLNNIKHAHEAMDGRVNILHCIDDEIRVELGKSTEAAGKSSVDALEKAVEDLKNKTIDVLVTAPIDKQNIQSENFSFPGHTEFLKTRFESDDVVMLMISELMKVGVVTGHVPVAGISNALTREKIVSKLKVMHHSLLQDFTIRKPKIAVLGLNPHAGDNGVIGNEEKDIITPAIEEAREQGIMALGPYPADGFFGAGSFAQFDAILAMYHDQGLAPFKALSIDGGVNFTAGLPIVRTSPAHGTAYELAGKGEASIDSFRRAFYLAGDIYTNRQKYNELTKNPLNPSKQEYE